MLLQVAAAAVVGRLPGWPYRGFERFPAEFFGSNTTGLDNLTQLQFDARFMVAGWGWNVMDVQSYYGLPPPGFSHGNAPPGYNFSSEEVLHREVKRLRSLPLPQPDATFVYRQSFFADWPYAEARRALAADGAVVVRDDAGRICSKERDPAFGVWDWLHPGTLQLYLRNQVATLCRQRAAGGAEIAYFDGVDANGALAGSAAPGTAGSWHGLNCSRTSPLAEWRARNAAAAAAWAQIGAALNRCGVYPVFSLGGAADPAVAARRQYVATEAVYIEAFAAAGVRWARYYEFWGTGLWGVNAGYGIANALVEARAGVPIHVHAYPTTSSAAAKGSAVRTSATYAVASFLIVQTAYSYFGISHASAAWPCTAPADQWSDCSIIWHPEYDLTYGAPLGNATRVGGTEFVGEWTREFSNAWVWVDEARTLANITLKSPRRTLLHS